MGHRLLPFCTDARHITVSPAYHLAAARHRCISILMRPQRTKALPIWDGHPKIRVITSDAAYWEAAASADRPEAHQQRLRRPMPPTAYKIVRREVRLADPYGLSTNTLFAGPPRR